MRRFIHKRICVRSACGIRAGSALRIRVRSCGYTLVEVLIAIVILSVGLILVIEGMARSQQAIRIGQNLVLTSQLAEEQLAEEEVEIRQGNKLRSGTDSGSRKEPGVRFAYQKRVIPYEHESIEEDTRLNRVKVKISWKEGPHRDMDWTLETLLLNPDEENLEL